MIIYNVTVKVEHSIHDEWFTWMKEKHIPDVLATGYFTKNNMYKIMVDDTDGISYSIQYSCNKVEDYQEYQRLQAPRLQKEHIDKYGTKCIAFRTLLQQV